MRRLLAAFVALAIAAILLGQIAGTVLLLEETGRWLLYALAGAPLVVATTVCLVTGVPPLHARDRVPMAAARPSRQLLSWRSCACCSRMSSSPLRSSLWVP